MSTNINGDVYTHKERAMGSCSECGDGIENEGAEDMGFCDTCLYAWWVHADTPHECSWGCVSDFREFAKETA